MNQNPISIWKRGVLPRVSLFRFVRWFFRWRNLRRCLFVLACLITLFALLTAEENWRGRHAWEKYKHEQEALGEKMDWDAFVPPPVPDDQNFAMTPFLRPLQDLNPYPLKPGQSVWRDTNAQRRISDFGAELFTLNTNFASLRHWPSERRKIDYDLWEEALHQHGQPTNGFSSPADAATALLKQYETYRPVLDEIQKASRLPYSRFNLRYSNPDPFSILLPHLAGVKKLADVLQLRAQAEVVLGRTDAALSDTETILFLSHSSDREPFLISGLVQVSIQRYAMRVIEEGLAAHQWTADQLAELETQLRQYDFIKRYGDVMRGERASGNRELGYLATNGHLNEFSSYQPDSGDRTGDSPTMIDLAYAFRKLVPLGWFHQNQLVYSRLMQKLIPPPEDVAAHRLNPGDASNRLNQVEAGLREGFAPFALFARMTLPALGNAPKRFAAGQVAVDETRIACALERYRLAHQRYPESLAALAPQFLPSVPPDVITGQPLKYRVNADGTFILYSVGWNETDDGGTTAWTSGITPQPDWNRGDWVWPMLNN